jgi:hypothetical protein
MAVLQVGQTGKVVAPDLYIAGGLPKAESVVKAYSWSKLWYRHLHRCPHHNGILFAVGISGAIQHVAGMSSSKVCLTSKCYMLCCI